MKVFKKAIIAATAVTIVFLNVCYGTTQPLTGNTGTVSAEKYDYLSYKKVDKDGNGTYDYIEIEDCGDLAKKIEIPSEIDDLPVTAIGDEAFSYCSSLENIMLSNSLTSIGKGAFKYCKSLSNITLPNSLTSIGEGAFEYCENFENITIPDSVTSIGDGAFKYCKNLSNITLPDGLTSINAFTGCKSLTNITIPNSVTTIGDDAFAY